MKRLMATNAFKNLSLLVFFILISLAIYYPVLRADPMWDDWYFIFRSWTIRNISPVEFWTLGPHRRSWPMFFTVISLMYKAWGDNTLYYHLSSILLHGINTFLLFRILKKLNGTNVFLIALFFLVHPLHFFTVSWIIQIKTIICISFFLLSLDCFLKSEQKNSKVSYVFSIIFFAFSLASKAVFAPLGFLMIFYSNKRKMAPFIALCVYYVILTLWSTHLKTYIQNFKITSLITSEAYAQVSPPAFKPRPLGEIKKIETNPLVGVVLTLNNLSRYVAFVVYPSPTLLIQPSTPVNYTHDEMLKTMLVFLLAIFLSFYYWEKKDFLFLSGMGFFSFTILPLCGLINIPIFSYTNFVEYWLSVPLLGIALCLSRINEKRRLVGLALCVFIFLFGLRTFRVSQENNDASVVLTKSLLKSPHNEWIKLTLAKHYYYKKDYIKSNGILLNLKKEQKIYNEGLERDINKNFMYMNDRKLDNEYTL